MSGQERAGHPYLPGWSLENQQQRSYQINSGVNVTAKRLCNVDYLSPSLRLHACVTTCYCWLVIAGVRACNYNVYVYGVCVSAYIDVTTCGNTHAYRPKQPTYSGAIGP